MGDEARLAAERQELHRKSNALRRLNLRVRRVQGNAIVALHPQVPLRARIPGVVSEQPIARKSVGACVAGARRWWKTLLLTWRKCYFGIRSLGSIPESRGTLATTPSVCASLDAECDGGYSV